MVDREVEPGVGLWRKCLAIGFLASMLAWKAFSIDDSPLAAALVVVTVMAIYAIGWFVLRYMWPK